MVRSIWTLFACILHDIFINNTERNLYTKNLTVLLLKSERLVPVFRTVLTSNVCEVLMSYLLAGNQILFLYHINRFYVLATRLIHAVDFRYGCNLFD